MSKAQPFAVFDWNGTLLDDVDAWVKGCNAALSVFGQGPRSLEAWQELYTCPIIHSYEKAGVPVDLYLEKADLANKAFYEAYQNETAKGFKLRPFARDLLQDLRDKGYVLTILSNHRHDLLQKEILSTRLEQYFSHICGNVTEDDIAHNLTKKERLSKYLFEYQVDKDKSFLIGDSHEEPYVGRALGLKTVSITGGYLSYERLKAAKPDRIIGQLSELIGRF